MKKLTILFLFVLNFAFGQSSILIEPNASNGIFSKNATAVTPVAGTVALPASGAGTRLMWIPAKSAFRVGTVEGDHWDAANIGTFSFATGENTKASGSYSISMGRRTTASGYDAISFGAFGVASGGGSICLGGGEASGSSSICLGGGEATGTGTISMGGAVAQSYNSLVFGRYNKISGTTHMWIDTEPLFVVGNGDFGKPNNALTLLKNGKLGVNLEIPDQFLDVNGRARIRHNGNTAGIWMSNSTNSTASADGAFYGMKNDTEAGIYIGNAWRLWVNSSGNMTVGGTVTASCGVLVCSDMRYKRNVSALNNSLNNILQINGVRYDYRKDEFPERNFSDKNQIGFIAQEIEKIFPEMVFTDEKGYKSVDYARLTPVLVEAMKELKLMNDEFRMKNEKLEANNQKLQSRIDKIEQILNK